MVSCPICGIPPAKQQIASPEVEREFGWQHDFVMARIAANPTRSELKDLTDFMHSETAPLARCERCGSLLRFEKTAGSYTEDPNDPDVMKQLYPRYVQAFRNKKSAYRPLLRPHAEVLELGSHFGAFLQVAEEWNWNAVGVDIGLDTSTFAKSQGLTVRRAELADIPLKTTSLEAVFIWNCFEQLDDPEDTLRRVRSLLRPDGLAVIRIPNEGFYRRFRHRGSLSRTVLAYNNLLGFPYLHGYTPQALTTLMAQSGFEPVVGFNSELLTTPFADLRSHVAAEQKRISRVVGKWIARNHRAHGTLTGPWIEVVYRRTDIPDQSRPILDSRFLRRAAA